jgi:hypothetical protein
MTHHWDLTFEDDNAALTDERLVYELLCGVDVRLPNKQLGKEYLAPWSKRERAARAALARLIRKSSPFPEFIRETLAALFDPASSSVPVERRIEFNRLHVGELKSRPEATLEIAMHVWLRQQLGDKKESAVESAVEMFGLKRRRILDICRKHADKFPNRSAIK